MRRRWAYGAILALLVVVAGLAWRAGDLNARLRDAAADLHAAASTIEGLETTSGDQRQELEQSSSQMKTLERELGKVRRELRDRQRCPRPKLILSPSSGPPGTRVNLSGYCFTGDHTYYDPDSAYGLFLINPAQDLSEPELVSNGGPDCELVAGTEPHRLIVHDDGTAEGYLTIPARGGCFQEDRTEAVSPGDYYVGLGCHTCFGLARFRVTG